MSRRMLTSAVVTILTIGGFAACSDQSPAAPNGADHRGSAPAAADHMSSAITTDVSALDLTPFTFRAPLDPFRIQQPGFEIRSEGRKDIVIQQSLFAPGAGVWHTHPGPSFVYVLQGEIKLDRFTRKGGCTETPVYGPGNAYFEEADQVHRAVVTSVDSAVVLVTRFNIPVGAPFTIMAADPGC
ncbi:MAG: cupin domain-containing protein [Gemmatimonadota bacterium]